MAFCTFLSRWKRGITSLEKYFGRDPRRHTFGGRYCLYDYKSQTRTNLVDGCMWVQILNCSLNATFYLLSRSLPVSIV